MDGNCEHFRILFISFIIKEIFRS